jgi:flagellar basal body rod protein FlgF
MSIEVTLELATEWQQKDPGNRKIYLSLDNGTLQEFTTKLHVPIKEGGWVSSNMPDGQIFIRVSSICGVAMREMNRAVSS